MKRSIRQSSYICLFCGIVFKRTKHGNENIPKFCTSLCFHDYRHANRPHFICLICNKEFSTPPVRRGTAKYCSDVCRIQGMQYHDIISCEVCGTSIVRRQFQAKKTGVVSVARNILGKLCEERIILNGLMVVLQCLFSFVERTGRKLQRA